MKALTHKEIFQKIAYTNSKKYDGNSLMVGFVEKEPVCSSEEPLNITDLGSYNIMLVSMEKIYTEIMKKDFNIVDFVNETPIIQYIDL